ncbi:molybdopterin-dependent oxidoreductase [Pseudonocardia sp. MCCB 268]|nr:molybdopterin-dependent oxidoreductase [Pseudonocardia cytotoxica]
MTCPTRSAGQMLISTANFVGVEASELLLEAGVRPGADQILPHQHRRLRHRHPTEVLLELKPRRAAGDRHEWRSAAPEHGFPVRMVVPGLYGFVSATMGSLHYVTTFAAGLIGYWLGAWVAQQAPIKTQSCIDRPRGFDTVPRRAWSWPDRLVPTHRHDTVEVRMDGGPRQAR